MKRKDLVVLFVCFFLANTILAQWNFTFNYNSAGQRVALVEATVSEVTPSITLHFLDAADNSSNAFDVSRRPLHGDGADWVLQTSLVAGTTTWTDVNVNVGDVWEYQVRRDMGTKYATGYVSAGIRYNQTDYKGRMILLIDDSMIAPLAVELEQLKKDLTGEGWFVQEIQAVRATSWYSGNVVVQVKQQIQNVWNAAPGNDKPTHLFIIGHVPVPRSGLDLQAPDGHVNSNGAVGSDSYYADLDGVYTDVATYMPAFSLYDPNAYNIPGDFKWDQDIIPSELELAFGRIDFFEIQSYAATETQLLKKYLNKLHDYRMVVDDMGEKTAFRLGYANSYDGSYRSLIPISGADEVYLESGSSNHPLWVRNNGPFQAYLQNSQEPSLTEWDTDGMDATVYASDQSFWGHWSMPETGSAFSKVRALLAADTKCLVTLWQSTAVNVFYQPGIGETMGMSCKRIMDHNSTNNNIEKPEQPYDTNDFWNRTHMQYHGDPAIRLFQVYPISGLTETIVNGDELQLDWTASVESSIIGYHVYKSATEFGQYQKISTSLVTGTTFTDVNVTISNEWYMVRAVKLQVTGSGTYLNPSTGVFIHSSLVVAPLPISLLGFSVSLKDNNASIAWKTAAEIDNSLFVIEKSQDAVQFYSLAEILPKGNSSTGASYAYIDKQLPEGVTYYRLKQIDISGETNYSAIRQVTVNTKSNQLSIYPNPTTGVFFIEANNIKRIEVINISGQMIMEVKAGINTLDLSNQTKGVYLIKVITNKGIIIEKMILK